MLENTILLVEDNSMDINLTIQAFSKHKAPKRIVIAKNGVEALDYLFKTGKFAGNSKREIPSLVLLDLNLPMIDGFEVLRRIREDRMTKRVPVVVLTTSGEKKDVTKSYKIGANSFISKPVEFDEFVDVCHQLSNYWLNLNETIEGQESR